MTQELGGAGTLLGSSGNCCVQPNALAFKGSGYLRVHSRPPPHLLKVRQTISFWIDLIYAFGQSGLVLTAMVQLPRGKYVGSGALNTGSRCPLPPQHECSHGTGTCTQGTEGGGPRKAVARLACL